MPIQIVQSSRYEDEDWWSWSVWLEGAPAELDEVGAVEYHLHPTFPQPIVRVADRQSSFRLDSSGWGTFTIRARLLDQEGKEVATLFHDLDLEYPGIPDDAGQKAPTSEKVDTTTQPYVFLSFSAADRAVAEQVKQRLVEQGLSVRSAQDIESGADWNGALKQMIAQSRGSVAVVTGDPSPFVEAEIRCAQDMGRPVVTVADLDASLVRPVDEQARIQLSEFIDGTPAAISAVVKSFA